MRQEDRALADGVLRTDLYQLTMAQLYHRHGLHERPAQFDYFFRRCPDYGGHQAGYCVCAGLQTLLDWMERVRFGAAELDCLRSYRAQNGGPLFEEGFLRWLASDGGFFASVSLEAVPEGRVVHPQTPIAVVRAPLAVAQVLESALLNHLNYETLVATKSARIREAGEGRPLLEFGLRRAQDGAAAAGVRAALIGGADFTSHVGASHLMGLQAKGTHAHSLVQVFMALGEGELEAFQAYADLYPDDCLLLVDTVDTLHSGVPNAIRVFEGLRRLGHRPVGIRLDSGDQAHLAIQSARMLDSAGFPDTSIVLSNQLDEIVIWQILTQIRHEAARYGVDAESVISRLVYGVGTRLITSAGAGALDGVYKLVAIGDGRAWQPAIKLSESVEKVPNPGRKRLWRLYDRRGLANADLVALADEDPGTLDPLLLRHPIDRTARRRLSPADLLRIEPLLEPQLEAGRRLAEPAPLETMRCRRESDVSLLDPGVRRLLNPHVYHVSLTERLWELKQQLIERYLSAGRDVPPA